MIHFHIHQCISHTEQWHMQIGDVNFGLINVFVIL